MNQQDHLKFAKPATEFLAVTLITLSLIGPAIAEDVSSAIPDATATDSLSVKGGSIDELSNMLPYLITSPDQKRLAAELLAAIEQGDLKGAERELQSAFDAGTLALILLDHLSDPKLLPALQKLDIEAAAPPLSPSAPSAASTGAAVCSQAALPVGVNVAELQGALDQEKSNSALISQQLAEMTEQHSALRARLEKEAADNGTKVSELQQSLQDAQQQREATARELVSLQKDYRTLQMSQEQGAVSHQSKTSELETLLRREKERGDGAERELSGLREEIRKLQAVKNKETESEARIAGLSEALAQAEAKGEELSRKLTETTEALQAAQASRASPPETRPLATGLVSADPSAQISVPSSPDAKTNLLPQNLQTDDRMTIRASELLSKGDVSGARLLLERSLASGNARAAFLLAETFDPQVLARLGVLGIRGDADKAREFYAKAKALGDTQASQRLEALK